MEDRRTSADGQRGTLHAEYKLWLEKNGGICGEGLSRLLSHVARLGSISRAAREMGMSYRSAWGKIKTAEDRWGVSLVTTQVGGEMGGGARLTPAADELLVRYRRLRQAVDAFVESSFQEMFRGWPAP